MGYYDEKEKQNTIKLREMLSSLPSFCKDYFRSIEQRTTSRTRIAYAYDIRVFFKFLDEKNPYFKNNKNIMLSDLDKITFSDIEEYMEYLKYYDDDKNEITNSATGIKRKIAALRSFYEYYYKHDLIKNNPTTKIDIPKIRDKEIIRLDADEVANFLDEVENGNNLSKKEKVFHEKTALRDTAMLTLMLGTGIRVSECIGINLSDIDKKNTAIKIKRKGAKEAIIYYGDEVEKALDEYINYRNTLTPATEKDNDALFLSLQNKRITARSVEKIVKKYAQNVTPLKHITPHKLRSTFGTNLYKETDDIYLVASVLGHNDVNTTKKHYAAIEDDKKRNARNKVKLRDN